MEDTPSPPAYCYHGGEKESPAYSERALPSRKALGDVDTNRGEGDTKESAYEKLLKSELFPETRRSLFSYKETIENTGSAFSMSPLRAPPAPPAAAVPKSIPSTPFAVLDAPEFQDDYYLNLLDWSRKNVLAVGLGSGVYTYQQSTKKVTRVSKYEQLVTSVAWTSYGDHLAVGSDSGAVSIFDAATNKLIRTMSGHSKRVGALAWNSYILSTGSRDRTILQRDVREPAQFMSRLKGHGQEVCGLKWSFDEHYLASGGNDNRLCIWSLDSRRPLLQLDAHQGAVKALAWSPHRRDLLASGGGTADRRINTWDISRGRLLTSTDTESQVCNLVWSRNTNELLSTHGYSLNQINVWQYPAMSKVQSLFGHTYRVLYLALSPDGRSVATGSGDETIRFWSVFPGSKPSKPASSALCRTIR